ncbi:MAG: hypothetical protein HYV40_06510 [Candidatus Levybacteria bacterium]|nr:hypothetical protein [Candidatus Levybacteria bacterium]
MNTFRKLSAAIATSALLLQSTVSIAAADTTPTVTGHDTTLVISGNGAYSDNDIDVDKTNFTTVTQSNTANVSNYVSGTASTGGNDANYNTGGDVAIVTGDAKSDVSVSNELNSNKADVNTCDCDGDVKVKIAGNGAWSDNKVDLDTKNVTTVFQTNDAYVTNYIDADAKTGGNDANGNTGGDVTILTGNAKTNVDVSTTANANIATVGGGTGDGNSLKAIISGNGAYSDNDIYLDFIRDTLLVQDNYANVYNWVDADATTGWNDANYNTGGDVAIKTGDAKAYVDIDNLLNFNSADLDCGCALGGKFAIKGNGYNSDSKIDLDRTDVVKAFQDNVDWTWNDADADAKTGKNDIKYTTGEADSDPLILTGDATQNVSVDNASNMNVFGSGVTHHFPEIDVDFDFDFSGFWMWLTHHQSSN